MDRKGEAKDVSSGSTEFRRSEFIESKVKVHLLNKGYAWVPKRRDFTEDSRNEILGNQNFQD